MKKYAKNLVKFETARLPLAPLRQQIFRDIDISNSYYKLLGTVHKNFLFSSRAQAWKSSRKAANVATGC